MTDNWTVQVSPKLPDGTLLNVRGESAHQVVEQLQALAAQAEAVVDSVALLGAAHNAKAVVNQPAAVPAATAPWTPPQGQAQPAAAQPGAAPSCMHGPREFKQGVSAKNNKPWSGWSCTAPKGQSCPMQWTS